MAVTITNKYAASSAGGNSGDIVVSAGEAVVVVLLPAAGVDLPSRIQCRLQRKLSTGSYRAVPTDGAIPALLSSERSELVLQAPGTYRVVVPATPVDVLVEEHR